MSWLHKLDWSSTLLDDGDGSPPFTHVTESHCCGCIGGVDLTESSLQPKYVPNHKQQDNCDSVQNLTA